MTIKQAVVERTRNLCEAQHIRPNELAKRAGVTPSTVYSFLDESRQEVTVNLVEKLCNGLGVSIAEFFDDEVFSKL